MASVPCGISLNFQVRVDNCKQPDLESPGLKLSNGMCLQNSPSGGGFHSLAHGLQAIKPGLNKNLGQNREINGRGTAT